MLDSLVAEGVRIPKDYRLKSQVLQFHLDQRLITLRINAALDGPFYGLSYAVALNHLPSAGRSYSLTTLLGKYSLIGIDGGKCFTLGIA